jgi:hypothetical protein
MWLETDTGNLFAWWVDPDSAAWVQVNVAVPVTTSTLPVYANNAAALAGGLAAGAFYRTGADPDHVCVVH